ncbi:MAG: hypothetical protein EOM20_14135 [Spartobacteria bacterium]|nr:hypothetical protein [Spartobacteria bacterium]
MRVAIVHYHLRTGGVTRVVENAVCALAPHQVSCVLFAGDIGDAQAAERPNAHVLPALNYGTTPDSCPTPSLLADMRAVARETLGGPPDIWHIHNHALGKNSVMPELVRALAEDGERLLLQFHDFAEDGRPGNYQYLMETLAPSAHIDLCLYPQAAHIHYATLNSRDYHFLQAAGIDRNQLHLLPNAVAVHRASTDHALPAPATTRRFLYPTRAIRRKNLGEFLLWSALAEPGDSFATSLRPENPVARNIHDAWADLARELSLPVEFARGQAQRQPLAALYRECHAVVTTSVAEGFGLAFLEPWLFDRPLLGRNIPDITHEFSDAGIHLDTLYPTLGLPVDWIDFALFKQKIADAFSPFMRAYGRTPDDAAVREAVNAAIHDDRVDFGRLDEPLQAQVIRKLRGQPILREQLTPASLCAELSDPAFIQNNRAIVETTFGLRQYGQRLCNIYAAMLEATPGLVTGLPHRQVLDQFLKPERFTLLRT